MTIIILLLALGLVLIAFEVILPGGILGAIGALLMIAGCGVAFYEYGRNGGLITTGIALGLAVIFLWIEFKILPKTKLGKKAFLIKRITGVSSAYDDKAKSLVGKTGEAMTTLSPSGYVRIDGQQYEAFCQSGHTEAGTPVKVVDTDNFRIITTKIQPE